MDDARAVRVREAFRHRERDLELARQRHPLGRAHPLLEVAPLEKLHGEKRQAFFLAEVVNGDDVAVRQLRGGTGLAEETIPQFRLRVELRSDDLDCDDPGEEGIERLVDGPHPSLADQLGDFVSAYALHSMLRGCCTAEYSDGTRGAMAGTTSTGRAIILAR